MFYNLKIAIKNLARNGIYSVINVVGLSVSLATVILIMLWVSDEYSYDKFHKRSEDIYLTTLSLKMGDAENLFEATPMPLALAAKAKIPEIENACRLYNYWNVDFLKYNDNILRDINCTMADSSFFSIFNFKIINGDVHNLLTDNYSIVLSEKVAKIMFGDEDPIGKTVEDNDGDKYHVTGIMADMPANSSLQYDVIFALSLLETTYPQKTEEWGTYDYRTYFMLHPNSDVKEVEQKLTRMQLEIYKAIFAELEEDNVEDWGVNYSLLALEKHNLYNADGTPNSKKQACRMFSISVVVLLLIACINYVNLVTSRASRRNKEIFVRSAMGARKWNLFAHFFNESLVLFLCSLIIATFLIYLLFPFYCQIANKQLEFHLFAPSTMLIYGLTFVVTSLLAGIYPALKLSLAKNSPQALINASYVNKYMRRVLVVLQFSASMILILVAIVSNRQLHFMKTTDVGYNKENLFYVYLSQSMRKHTDAIKAQLTQLPEIKGVTFTSENLSNVGQFSGGIPWEGQANDERVMFTVLFVDKDFIPLMNIKLAEGANFTGMPADSSYYLVNRAAVKAMDMQNPVGKSICHYTNGKIIGVTEDFYFKKMYKQISPLLISTVPSMWVMYVKADANNIAAAIESVEKVYNQYNTDIPFMYKFVNDEFERVYKADIRTGLMFNIFSLIAILISCLGLFGLVTYTAETKTKEIGIRKVMGGSVMSIITMLSKEFLILVGISMLLAFPLSYYWLEKILQDYAYRINISWLIFAFAGLITVVLTLLSVGWKAAHAAMRNPVKALKTNDQ
jgi:ABC-type antimicrobial peptide transport system permease subunit